MSRFLNKTPIGMRPLQTALILFFLFGWIVPVAYYGFTNKAPWWLPKLIRDKTNVSRLFYREYTAIPVYEIRIQRKTFKETIALDEALFFRMRPFGFRTRLQRLISLSTKPQREQLANWLRSRLDEDLPSDPVKTIQIIRFQIPKRKNSELLGHYVQPTSSSALVENLQVIDEYRYP